MIPARNGLLTTKVSRQFGHQIRWNNAGLVKSEQRLLACSLRALWIYSFSPPSGGVVRGNPSFFGYQPENSWDDSDKPMLAIKNTQTT
jgi:hypothetical protein